MIYGHSGLCPRISILGAVPCGPTLRAVDAAGAALNLGAILKCAGVPVAVPIQTPASGATDALRWAVQSCAVQTILPVRKRIPTK